MNIRAHLGIRYASLTQRFGLPQPAEGQLPVEELSDVPIFPQLPGRLEAAMGNAAADNPHQEDAFFLNVWAPEDATDLPVLLFIHGGAWTSGGGSVRWYDGSALARRGMVVVTGNYRIGPFGHLNAASSSSGVDLPLQDLLLLVDWVRRHIGSYGGDPARVTLAGHSAGAWYAHLLATLPEPKGAFHRVALLSLPSRAAWSPATAHAFATHAAQAAGAAGDPEPAGGAGDLSTLSAPDLLRHGAAALATQPREFGVPRAGYLPTGTGEHYDHLFDPQWCAHHYHVAAAYVRTTAEETGAHFFAGPEFSSSSEEDYLRLVAATTRAYFTDFSDLLAQALPAHGIAVQTSRFTHRSPLAGFLSGHCLDLPYQFGILDNWSDAAMLAGESPQTFQPLSTLLMDELASFVTTP